MARKGSSATVRNQQQLPCIYFFSAN